MSVYVTFTVADKPRVQHLPWPTNPRISLCRKADITNSEEHAARRRRWLECGSRKSTATPIDYAALPMCKFCQRAADRT